MSRQEFKRGDVIMTRYGRVFFYFDRATKQLHYIFDDGSGSEVEKDTAFAEGRPLVVIDPENDESCDELAELIWPHYSDEEYAGIVQVALRSLGEPQKPEEPAGIGAVVEYDGSVWISLGHHRWLELPDDRLIEPRRFHWADFPSGVRNLSDGWTPDAAGGAS